MTNKKNSQISESIPLAILLTISGGFMDTYSYMCRGEVFANAQTGNILLFGVNLSTGNFQSALKYFMPVLAFVLGIGIAEFTRHVFRNTKYFHWRQATILAEVILLLVVAFLPQHLNLLANSLTSLACGAQVESFRKVRGSQIATTMCIGNLRSATQALCDYKFTKNKSALENSFLYFGIIGMFVIGAVIGNLCVNLWQEKAIMVSSFLLLIGHFLMLIQKEE